MHYYDVKEGEITDIQKLPGYDMTVAEFEAVIEAIYGVEVDVELAYQIDGWSDANSTMKAIYVACVTSGAVLLALSVIIIYLNELKNRRLHNVWRLLKLNLV